jgi:hypothetical protein
MNVFAFIERRQGLAELQLEHIWCYFADHTDTGSCYAVEVDTHFDQLRLHSYALDWDNRWSSVENCYVARRKIRKCKQVGRVENKFCLKLHLELLPVQVISGIFLRATVSTYSKTTVQLTAAKSRNRVFSANILRAQPTHAGEDITVINE